MGAGLLYMYEVNLEGSTKKRLFYFNIYEKGKIVCPKGFQIKKIEEIPKLNFICNISNLLNFGLKGFSFYLCNFKNNTL